MVTLLPLLGRRSQQDSLPWLGTDTTQGLGAEPSAKASSSREEEQKTQTGAQF